MFCRAGSILRTSLTMVCLAAFAPLGMAQSTQPAREIPDSRIDLYGGYGYFHPINSGINGYQYTDISNLNTTGNLSLYFNRYVGVQIEGGYFNGPSDFVNIAGGCPEGAQPSGICYTHDQKIYDFEGGPVVRWPLGRFIPYVHALGGGVRINGPAYQPLTWGWGVTGGGGVDYVLPFLNNHLAIRLVQADFQYSQVVYGPLQLPTGTQGGFGEIDALKLSGGLVGRFGSMGAKQNVMLGCTTEPASVFPGNPVAVTGSVLYLDPRRKAVYTWTTNGGKVTATGANSSIDTTGIAPGDYEVLGKVVNGSKVSQQASCKAPFTVRAFEPPTLTCSASPATVPSGTSVDIATNGTSPQNRPLSYSYSTSAGTVVGTGPTAKLNTDGLSPSTVTVTCNAVDDKGQTATATTQVTIENPPVPVIPQTKTLCSVAFTRDAKRPVRVDNEAKGCLDDIALTLQQQTDAKLVIVGNASADENPTAAAERTLNIRQYLTQEKGIDPARIDVRLGDTSGRGANDILIPAGSTYSDVGTQTFDEKSIVRHGQAYGKGHTAATPAPRKPAHHTHAAPAQHAALPPATDAPNMTVEPSAAPPAPATTTPAPQ